MQQAEDEEQSACSALTAEEAKRYGRQLLLPQFGVEGQKRLAESSVLLVGAGGLGSPIALYLAGAGVGCLGIVDDDTVELSNLHRQIIHSEQTVGQPKALSAQQAIQRLNSSINVIPYNTRLTSENALQLLESYDVVVDATDNIATRYLLNDSCVLSGRPLVSGSALGLEGRLTVYHYRGGPCYRCVWPRPPPPGSLGSCSENGVLGIVPGIIGSLQALEVIKVLAGMGEVLSQKMLLFSATNTQPRVIGLPPRNPKCVVCNNESSTTATTKLAPMEEYERFCGVSNDKSSTLSILPSEHHVSCVTYYTERRHFDHLLLDVRPTHEFKISSLPHATSIPLSILSQEIDNIKAKTQNDNLFPVYVICRRGNDSQKAVQALRAAGWEHAYNIEGGLVAWAKDIDPTFPLY